MCCTAAENMETLRVDDVHEFAGHIVCDPESISEVVVPLSLHGQLVAVLDIDSPTPSRFGAADQRGVELLCETFLRHLEKNSQSPADFI